MQRLVYAVVLGVALLFSLSAQAAGDDFAVQRHTKHFIFYAHGINSQITRIIDESEDIRAQYVQQLGQDFDGVTKVYIAASPAEFSRLQPGGSTVPEWAIGVAWAEENIIVLKYASINGNIPDLYKTFRHELSHIALGRVTGYRNIPKWFVEGVAMFLAREWSFSRHEQMLYATLAGNLYSFEDIRHRFPAHHAATSLAYTQSLNLVDWLYGYMGPDEFHAFIRAIGSGEDFYVALERLSGRSTEELEALWLRSIRVNYSWLPLLTGSGFLWFAMSLLFIWGYIAYRRRKALHMRKLALEDAFMYGEALPRKLSWKERRGRKRLRLVTPPPMPEYPEETEDTDEFPPTDYHEFAEPWKPTMLEDDDGENDPPRWLH